MSLTAGTRLGPYEILGILGAGGMGEVYRARDTKLVRDVAIKALPDGLAGEAERIARFLGEAQTLAALNHPNIAAIYGMEEIDSGGHALVMELVEGEDLSVHIERGPMPSAEAVAIARQIADALEAAHEQGIVHRDLKPANVKVRADGMVKVLDFGLAKAMDPGAPGPDLAKSPTLTARATQMGTILGTAAYMSPEQAKGKAVDRRADIWAFGVVLHEMLTGRRLFEAETVSETLAAVLRQEIDVEVLPEGTPEGVRRLIARCLDRDARTRLRDIGEARVTLAVPMADRAVPATPRSNSASASALARWLPVLIGLGAGLAIAFGLWARFGGAAAPATSDRPPAVTFRRLTEVPGPETQPDISPDGRQILYTSGVTGHKQIYLLRVGGGRAISLSSDPGSDDEQARFSPSGDQIVFRSSRNGGGLFVMGATGESVRRLTKNGFDPAWSHDGRFIAYATAAVNDPYSRAASSELWTLEVATGKATKLYDVDAVQPVWSPDDARIAFWANTAGQRDIWTIAATGGKADPVTQDASTDWSPAWSPDGRWLYFESDRGGSMNVWRVPIDSGGGATTRDAGDPQPVTSGVRALGYGRFSADGTRMVVMGYERTTDVTVARFDPENPEQFTPSTMLRNQSFRLCSPSPDGAWLACSSLGAQEDLLIMRSDGAETRRLTDDAFKDRMPTWSPDGQSLAFFSPRSGRWEAWVIQVDGSGLRQLTNLDNVTGPTTWSPDGKRAVSFSDGTQSAWLLDTSRTNTSENAEPLTEAARAGFLDVYAWSPTGTLLAGRFSSDSESAVPAVWDLGAKTLRKLEVPGANLVNSWISFLPDSRRLLLNSRKGLMLVDRADGSSRLIRAGDGEDDCRLSRDGRTLVIQREIFDSDIWLMELAQSVRSSRSER